MLKFQSIEVYQYKIILLRTKRPVSIEKKEEKKIKRKESSLLPCHARTRAVNWIQMSA